MTSQNHPSITLLPITLTEADLVSAFRKHRMPSRSKLLYELAWVVFVAGSFHYIEKISISTIMMILGAAAAGVAAYFLLAIPHTIRKAMVEQKSLHGVHHVSADPSFVFLESDNEKVRVSWDDLTRTGETDSVILLYRSSAMFHTIPKRYFSDSVQLETFRKYAKLALPP